jgi:hypothetical protein
MIVGRNADFLAAAIAMILVIDCSAKVDSYLLQLD